jgi:ATP synthase subunit 6
MHNSKIIPSSSQAFIENVFFFIINLVENQIKLKGLKLYGAFLFTLFILILKFNVIGLIRYTFTVTSHLAISLGMSLSIFFGVIFIGFRLHNERYLDLFLPLGVRLILQPMLIYIEIVGFFAKAVSLGVRLSANMMAGHTLLKLTTMLV